MSKLMDATRRGLVVDRSAEHTDEADADGLLHAGFRSGTES